MLFYASPASSAYPCVVSKRSEDGPLAALATMTAALQSPIGLTEVRRLSGGARVDRLESFLVLASLSGLRAQAMEGGYDDLASVELPLVLVLRDAEARNDEARRFAVLYQVDAEAAWVADPRQGLVKFPRAEVEAIWTGDVVALTRDPDAEQEVIEDLDKTRDPRSFVLWGGVSTAIFVISWLRVLAGMSVGEASVSFALATALAAALWSSLRGPSCAACNQASKLVGALPIAALGAVFYGGLWIVWMLVPGHFASVLVLAAAVGVHGALVRLLHQHRLVCPPCLITAGAALFGFAAAFLAGPASIESGLLSALVAATASAAGVRGLRLAREISAWRRRSATFDLVNEVRDEAPSPTGKARMVIYKRPGCAACAIFDATLRPGLEETFGERLSIETRRPEDLAVPTPLVMIFGAGAPRVVDVQEQEEPFEVLVDAVSASLGGPSASGFMWVG